MNDLYLVKPTKDIENAIWEYRKEYFDYDERHINGSCGIGYYENFDEWLLLVTSIEKNKLSREGVNASTFFSVRKSDNKIIGSIQLRHSLTDELKKHGGHIGYGIRPTERKKGFGKKQLMLVLDIAKQIGLSKVMISCDADNVASSSTAVGCGAVLIDTNFYNNKKQHIFWIELTK